MFRADSGIEDVTCLQDGAVLDASIPIAQFHPPIGDRENLLAVVDVPLVGPVRPVEAGGDATHVGDVCCAPRAICFEGTAAEYFHAVSNTRIKPDCSMQPDCIATALPMWSAERTGMLRAGLWPPPGDRAKAATDPKIRAAAMTA